MESASEKHSEADAPRPGQRPGPQHGSSAPAVAPWWGWSGGRTPPPHSQLSSPDSSLPATHLLHRPILVTLCPGSTLSLPRDLRG